MPLIFAAQGLRMLVGAFWQNDELFRQEVLLDLSPPPESRGLLWLRYAIFCGLVMIGCWSRIQNRPWLEAVSYSIFIACGTMTMLLHLQRKPGLLAEGMLIPTRFLGFRSQAYIPWNLVKNYTWKGSDLILNPGWRQTTCVIPEEFVHVVEAILIDRCPLVGLDSLETH